MIIVAVSTDTEVLIFALAGIVHEVLFFALARVVVVSAMTYGAYVFEDMRISMVVALCLSGAYVLERIRMSAFLGNLRGTYAKIKATRICCRQNMCLVVSRHA